MSNKPRKDSKTAKAGNETAPRGGRLYRGISEEARRAERRRAFIRAGIAVFGRDGFAGATTRGLCAEAGLTQRYFYESFESLEDLFVAVTNHLGSELEAEIDAAVQHAERSVEAVTLASLTAFFSFIHNDRPAARILMIEMMTVGPKVERAVRKFTEGRAEHLREIAVQLRPELAHDLGNVRLISSGLVGAARNIALAWMASDFAEPLEEVVDSAMRIYSALLPGARSRPARRIGLSRAR